jgi:MtN3 and saliva related transmembrane protein
VGWIGDRWSTSRKLRELTVELYAARMPGERGEMISLATVIGRTAGVCTTFANLPQLMKAWTTRETDDISLKTLLLLGCGLILWVVYGVLHEDIIIILANGASLMILTGLLYAKLIRS